MNKTRINNMIKLLESYSNKKVILKEDEDEFDINFIFQPNERAKQELERRKKESKENFQKIKLGLKKINKAFENKQWKSEEEKLFLELFYKSKTKLDSEEYPNKIFIMKNDELIAYQDLKNKWFWINYELIWEVFQNEFRWNYDKTQSFMKTMLNKYFKLRGYTPNILI